MRTRRENFIFYVIFLFCLAIRVALLDQKNLWFDEVFSWHITSSSFYEIIVRTTNDIHPPLYYFILKIWDFCFGDSVFTMRLLSAICTSAALFYLYPICRRFMGSGLSFAVLVLYSINPLNIYYSQEARMSGMNLLFNVAAVYYFIRLLESTLVEGFGAKAPRRIPPKGSIKTLLKEPFFYGFVLFQSAAIYTHYFSFFIIIAEIIFLIILFRTRIKEYFPFLISYAAIFFIYIPWISTFVEHIKRGQSWREKQTIMQVLGELLNYLKQTSLGLYYYYGDLKLVDDMAWILLAFVVLCIVGTLIKRKVSEITYLPLLISLMVIVPLLLASISSLNQKIEFYRYLSILVPYMIICFIYFSSKLRFKPLWMAMIVIYSCVNLYGMYMHYKFDFKNDDYRPIIQYMNQNYEEGDKIYIMPHYCGWIINYTKKQENLRLLNFVDHRYGWDILMDSISVQKPPHFWLILDYSALDTTNYEKHRYELDDRYVETYEKTYEMAPAKVVLYRYRKR